MAGGIGHVLEQSCAYLYQALLPQSPCQKVHGEGGRSEMGVAEGPLH